MASPNSPASDQQCSACIQLGSNCSPTCVFASCFPPNRPNKFAIIHRAYGALNVMTWLSCLPPEQRIAASDQLAHDASMYLRSHNNNNNNNNNHRRQAILVNSDVTEEEAARKLPTVKDSMRVMTIPIEDHLPENPFNMKPENYHPGESSSSNEKTK